MRLKACSALLSCLAAAASLPAAEPFVVPSFLKSLEDLDEVVSDAARSNKGVTFLLMAPGST